MGAFEPLSGWGRFPVRDCRVTHPRAVEDIRTLLDAPVIARGAGRAYGDSALGTGLTLVTDRLNRMLGFDPLAGELEAEAGVLLGDIVDTFLPRGWLPPVMPGTRFVTIGGMIAADVHGKNHRRDGSFGAHVRWIELLGADGDVVRCGPDLRPDLFEATVGGMGLTGIVLRARIALRRVETAWMRQETLAVDGPEAALAALEQSGGWSHAIAWIDCLAEGDANGRALVYRGDHARLAELDPARARAPLCLSARAAPGVPVAPPVSLVGAAATRAMNAQRWRAGRDGPRDELVGWPAFFFPLDALGNWNRLYGPRGFVQYQCVLPLAESPAGIPALLAECRAAGLGAYLATLKRFGPGRGGISFPMEGYSLALDFPATPPVLDLLGRLDRVTLDHGGRFYLAKDARLPRAALEAADPRVAAFRDWRQETGAAARFASRQSERVGL